VEGVRAGDALAIDILDIRTADWGYCSERVYEIREGHVVVNSRLRLAVQPMLGVVGIAPAKGGMDTRAPGDTGGNMDCREVRAGATLVFTAQAPGALAGFGDAHALQGDGEISGQGIETDAEALVRFRVLGEQLSPRPVILAPEWVATLGAHQDLAEAAWQATDDMVKLLSRQSRREEQEARLLVNLLGRLRVNQIVDPKKGARMEMPAWIFGT
jgi:amidase